MRAPAAKRGISLLEGEMAGRPEPRVERRPHMSPEVTLSRTDPSVAFGDISPSRGEISA
jgi:glycyl-tRNA synthetase beta chain